MPIGQGNAPVDVSIVVPVKDEVESIAQLVREIRDAFDRPSADTGSWTWEVVIVDDGSTDGSWDVIQEMAEVDPRVGGIRLRRNLGKSSALRAGVVASRGMFVATMDGDLQFDPRDVVTMADVLSGDVDLVAGATNRDLLSKGLASRIFNRVTGVVTGLRLSDHNCGLKVGRREVFEAVPLYGEMHRYIAVVADAMGYHVVEREVTHRPRPYGASKFGRERFVRGALDLLTIVTLTQYGRRPAHLFGGVGVLVGVVAMSILLYLTGVWFVSEIPIGNRPLLLFGVLLAILSVQLTSFGLLAELIVSRDAADDGPLREVVDSTASMRVEGGSEQARQNGPRRHRDAGPQGRS